MEHTAQKHKFSKAKRSQIILANWETNVQLTEIQLNKVEWINLQKFKYLKRFKN